MELEVLEGHPEQCSIGQASKTACHLLTFARKAELKQINKFTLEQRQLMSRRSGLQFHETSLICLHHEALLISKFEFLQKKCCNPFLIENHIKKKNLRPIDFQTADYLKKSTNNDIKPGQKLCISCRKELEVQKETENEIQSLPDTDDKMEVSEKLNTSLKAIGFSPLKFQKVGKRDLLGYAKHKVTKVHNEFAQKIASVANLVPDDIIEGSTSNQCEKCSDYNKLLEALQQKFKVSNRKEQLQILTLVPDSWSICKIMAQFDASKRMVMNARKLKKEKGILAIPSQKLGHNLSDHVKQKVLQFYEDDEFSRICPGQKEYISIRINTEKVMMQKRLLLSNLKEMFIAYRDRNGHEVGFSKFCELRPKWCVPVGSAGTHSVCVCIIHQNIKLMLAASPIVYDYKSLLSKTVCELDSKDCMLQRCDKCPGKEGLESFLKGILEDNDPQAIIEFRQWLHTDRDTLYTEQLPMEDFTEVLITKICNLSCHHYISKHQTSYLKSKKENLEQGNFIILMDFAENYSFIVQDAVQSFHWENSQATLHPFVVYYKDIEELKCISFCMISDCLRHDTIAVHVYLTTLITYLKKVFEQIKHISYFSDGSTAQYKNFKNLMNLCQHPNDFNIESAEWNFFATSHGKSPCDGIGGTAKRLARRASLQRPIDNQILTPRNLFDFCEKHVSGIKFFFVSKEEIDSVRPIQEERFKYGQTVAGTRDNHQFRPIDEKRLYISRVSNDTSSFIAYADKSENTNMDYIPITNLHSGKYVACIYENQWWIGNICEISVVEKDALITFMHPHGIANSFHWPLRKDTCWIPEHHIIDNLPIPTSTAMGRQYTLPKVDMMRVDKKFKSIISCQK